MHLLYHRWYGKQWRSGQPGDDPGQNRLILTAMDYYVLDVMDNRDDTKDAKWTSVVNIRRHVFAS